MTSPDVAASRTPCVQIEANVDDLEGSLKALSDQIHDMEAQDRLMRKDIEHLSKQDSNALGQIIKEQQGEIARLRGVVELFGRGERRVLERFQCVDFSDRLRGFGHRLGRVTSRLFDLDRRLSDGASALGNLFGNRDRLGLLIDRRASLGRVLLPTLGT